MPANNTDVVLEQGKHELDTRGAAPKGLTDLKKADFSLHHILPYRYPLFVGFLVEKYWIGLRGKMPGWPDTDLADPVARSVRDFLVNACAFRSTQSSRGLATNFAWMAPNLFQGPSGNLRTDDPHNARETVKPISMDQGVWIALSDLETAIKRVATVASEDGYTATLNKAITVLDLKTLLRSLDYFVQRGHSNALKFAPADWILMWSSDPNYRVTDPVGTTFKDRFAELELRTRAQPDERIIRFKPKLETMDLRTLGLWRLRLAGEPAPYLTFQTNRLQP